jgi:signal transduction histidine kinase
MSFPLIRSASLGRFVLCCVSIAVNPVALGSPGFDLSIAQHVHTAWTVEQGAPAAIRSLAQTSDGWLWLGGPDGLHRFDGIRFESVAIDGLGPRRSRAISVLLALESGGLWIGYVHGGTSLLKDGRFTHFDESQGMGQGAVVELAQDAHGTLWAACADGLRRFDGKTWKRIGVEWGFPDRYAQAVKLDQHGTLWVAGERTIFFLERDGTRFQRIDLPFISQPDFLQSPDGRTWCSDNSGLHLLPDQTGTSPRSPWVNSRSSYISLIDDSGGLWSQSLVELASLTRRAGIDGSLRELLLRDHPESETFGAKDGLTAKSDIKKMLEDREGNIWIPTEGGIDRFRYPNLVRMPFNLRGAALAAGDSGSVWIGAVGRHTTDGLWKYDGTLRRISLTPAGSISALDRDVHGLVWAGGPAGIWRNVSGDHFVRLPELPESTRGQEVHALTVDAAGVPWVSIVRSQLFQLRDATWELNGNIAALPDARPQIQTRDESDRLWIGYGDGTIAVIENDMARIFGPKDGLDFGAIFAIHAGRHTVVAGDRQVAIRDGEHFHPLSVSDSSILEGVTGIVETSGGDLWLNGLRGAVRIAAADLANALRQKTYRVQFELFDAGDGFPGAAQQVRPVPTLIQGTDGRLWFAGSAGVAWIDPAQIHRNTMAPPVSILSATAGTQKYLADHPLQLPKGTKDLRFDYTALSLTRPENIHFRYRLEGFDTAWQDAGTRRQAFYTNIGPGRYRFRVAAANENGVWNEAGASLDTYLPPTFLQTSSFKMLCAVCALAVLSGVYLVGIRQLTARERGRLAIREAERERIARELHDTLLQGVQGLTLKVHAVARKIPPGSPASELIDSALQTADKICEEGGDHLQGLRISGNSRDDLPTAIRAVGAELATTHSATFRFLSTGNPRSLHPLVQEECLRIASEALMNAFRHAMATTIHAEVIYDRRELSLRVRDDGRGIEAEILEAGNRPGHWGFAGMRERAETLRARLDIRSQVGCGTEVELKVPARVAYRRVGDRFRRPWWNSESAM